MALAAGVWGCGGDDDPAASQTPSSGARFDPSDFGDPVARVNKWLPLKVGTQWVREGFTDVGTRRVPHRVISTVTEVSREVEGVRTVALFDQDVDGGQIVQQSLDYLAGDKEGNVWYLGSYTEEYEGGEFVTATDAWLAGVKGAKPGILMQADPRTGTPPYFVAQPPGGQQEVDVAQVVETGQSQCVPFKCYENVRVIREGKEAEPDNEFKYFAPGVGQILNTPRKASKHQDVEKLINLTQLSPRGLAELSREALKLDRNAKVAAPDVFGDAPTAKPTL
ncbi:MAG: hypothetical protein ACRDT1_13500 [Micromonosporaceae bacterium]